MLNRTFVGLVLSIFLVAPMAMGIEGRTNRTRGGDEAIDPDDMVSVMLPDANDTLAPAEPPSGLGRADPWLDAQGDEMFGDLVLGLNAITFAGGELRSGSIESLTFAGREVCVEDGPACGFVRRVETGAGLTGGPISDVGTLSIADGGVATGMLADAAVTEGKLAAAAVTSGKIADGAVSEPKLDFDPATQTELDDHRRGADHDGRYFTQSELSNTGALNDGSNPVDWTKLKGVPDGFADGIDDDTLYSAGAGLTLSGTEFSGDTSVLQARVTGACDPGSAIASIAADGNVACEADDDTTYAAGVGLSLTDDVFAADTAYLQRRVGTACPEGEAIRAIAADGAVECEPDDVDGGDAATLGGLDPSTFLKTTGGTMTGALTAQSGIFLTGGRLGIGTAAPTAAIGLAGTGDRTIRVEGATGSALVLEAGAAADAVSGGGNVVLQSGRPGEFDVIQGSAIKLRAWTPASIICSSPSCGPTLRTAMVVDASSVGIATESPTGSLSFGAPGPTTLPGITLAGSRSIEVQRPTSTSWPGGALFVRSGGAAPGGTNLAGGDLVLSSGTATGSGSSSILLRTAQAGASGTTDRLPATRMAILGNGDVGIGTSAPTQLLHVRGGDNALDRVIFMPGADTDALLFTQARMRVGIETDAPLDPLHVAGNIRVGTGTTGCVKDADATIIAGTCSSDARFKRDIRPFDRVLDKLVQLVPVHFTWRADEFPEKGFGERESFGLIAQDVEKVLPELVTQDEDGYKAVRYSELPLLTLQAVKELEDENDRLEERVAALEALVTHMLEGAHAD